MTLAVYRTKATFPRSEVYGLTGQIRRSCASIPANVAEGYGRDGDAELARFLRMAVGSASALEYHRLFERLAGEVKEIKRMLTAFVKRLREAPRTKG